MQRYEALRITLSVNCQNQILRSHGCSEWSSVYNILVDPGQDLTYTLYTGPSRPIGFPPDFSDICGSRSVDSIVLHRFLIFLFIFPHSHQSEADSPLGPHPSLVR